MRLVIAAVGRLKDGPERALFERYFERANAAGRAVSLAPVELIELAESSARRAPDRIADESARLEAALPKGARRILLDTRGRSLTSEEFASRLVALRNGGAGTAAFLIGGADGLSLSANAALDLTISFGPATFPHQIVRILLAEQIYRAITILSGHPYHRA
jgi:23S rRNA (pseudouridine1915-N3)-methyltransferase